MKLPGFIVKVSSDTVTRFLAAIMFLVWTACYVRCAAEISGKGEVKVDACCKHEQPVNGSESAPCGICDAIVSGGLLLSQPLFLVALMASLVAVITLAFPALMLGWLRRLALTRSKSPQRMSDPPWREPRLWEFLARTACPVRGPSMTFA